MDVTSYYLTLSAVLFSLGTLGVLVRRNTIIVLMCIELMLNAVNISFVALSRQFGTVDAQIYVFFVMAIAAAEVAVGLSIIILGFKNCYSVETEDFQLLQG